MPSGNALDQINALLALCARVDSYPSLPERLARASFSLDWNALPDRAEAHGLTPLVYAHMKAAGVAMPPGVQERLRANFLRHAHASRVRTRVIAEIVACLKAHSIEVLLLKGAALAHCVYPRAVLRPMRDVDLLVRTAEAEPAQAALASIGFALPPSPMHGLDPRHHHLATVWRLEAGVSIGVEVHRGIILQTGRRATATFDDLAGRSQIFPMLSDAEQNPVALTRPSGPLPTVDGASPAPAHQSGRIDGRTLGAEDLLWHVYRHGFNAACEPLRLIWVADLITLIERWIDRLDWTGIEREYPAVLRILPVLHAVAPLQDHVAARFGLSSPRAHAHAMRLRRFEGWPSTSLRGQSVTGLMRLGIDALFPPAWWLCTAYGRGTSRMQCGLAWLAHLSMLGETVTYVARRRATRTTALLDSSGLSTPWSSNA